MNELAVVIPIYKSDLSVNEKISLNQVVKCLGKYDIFFLAPDGLRVNSEFTGIEYVYFEQSHFQSVNTYSQLMLKEKLYRAFEKYRYILIYQLDAFVFGSNIERFIEYEYDYIGAPTLEGMYKPYRDEKVLFTQNGGLSLRKTDAFINWTRSNADEIALMCKFDTEDSIIYALRKKGIKIAPVDVALEFSFDSNVKECFKRTNGKLPFGCHAWERYDYETWRPHIEKAGYKVGECDESKRIIKDYYNITKYNNSWIKKYNSSVLVNVIKKLLKNYDGQVYVWGMGRHGYDAMQLLLGAGIEIVAFLDNDPERIKDGMYPCKAITVNEAIENNKLIPIVVAMYNHVDACVFLEGKKLHHNVAYITYMELFAAFEIETMRN